MTFHDRSLELATHESIRREAAHGPATESGVMPARFVILHHTGACCEHWDLMLERENSLVTWQLMNAPEGLASLPIDARRIGNHRLYYLEYEGTISEDRGAVRRFDFGTVKIENFTGSACDFILDGARLAGRLTLSRRNGDVWVLDRADIGPRKPPLQAGRSPRR